MIENDTIAAVASGVGGSRYADPRQRRRSHCRRRPDLPRGYAAGGWPMPGGLRSFTGRSATAKRLSTKCWFPVFRAPHSYTGEDMIEVSCHASAYIQREVMRLLVESGVRTAQPGEFTLRAFLAGKWSAFAGRGGGRYDRGRQPGSPCAGLRADARRLFGRVRAIARPVARTGVAGRTRT